jgi:hypothetical protein
MGSEDGRVTMEDPVARFWMGVAIAVDVVPGPLDAISNTTLVKGLFPRSELLLCREMPRSIASAFPSPSLVSDSSDVSSL